MIIRVAVTGVKGRTGLTVVEAVRAAEGMELVAAFDVEDEIPLESLNAMEVVADFSIPSVTESNAHALLNTGVDVVVGTTGWTEESYERVHVYVEELGGAALIAPNFAMGVVFAMKLAALAALYFESAEVIEMHHPNKVDAPSGTAIATTRGIGAACKDTGLDSMPDATQSDPGGTHGGLIDGAPACAVRLHGLTALGEILLGNPGEQLVIRTNSFDRVSFIPGVTLVIRSTRGRVGLTVGLDKILDI